MQRTSIILAFLFVWVSSIAQLTESPEQYPFVHYTPKEGLISNMIKHIYQDSKGRLYFTSIHGLSVYDGSRFINYTSKNGLNFDIVNYIMEMSDDSIWVVTNSSKINCLVKGKMKTLDIEDKGIIINNLCKDENGDIYATSEQGLYVFDKGRFTKLPFTDTSGTDINFHLAYFFSVGDYLLIQRDYPMLPGNKSPLYVYNKLTKKTTAEHTWIFNVNEAPDKRIWVSTEKGIMALDRNELRNGRIALQELPEKYTGLKNLGKYFIQFDSENNCWLGNQSNILIKASPDGSLTSFTPKSGLSMFFINHIMMDREGITWIATNNSGVNKLVHSNFSLLEKPYYLAAPFGDIYYNTSKDRWLLLSKQDASFVIVNNKTPTSYRLKNPNEFDRIAETPYGIFATGANSIYQLIIKDKLLDNKLIFLDTIDNAYSSPMVDKNGSFVVCGKYYISALIKGKFIFRKKLNHYADYAVSDTSGNIWVATRAGDLVMYELNPDEPANYFIPKLNFQKELVGISPRSIIIDHDNNIWIGTRNHGIHVFYLKDGALVKKFSITMTSGLSDDFTYHLVCDANNNIWASSSQGLDKISLKNGIPVVENLTKQNNIYQSVFKIVIDKNNIAWGTVSNGLIKITPEKEKFITYSPTLLVSIMKAGKDTIPVIDKGTLSYKQSNLTFSFAATSFLDEKQVMYSYRLQGASNDQWSEPSNNATVSFIDLRPGDYTLEIKAVFPASRYPEKTISYQFSIAPAWWQTWWFKSVASLIIVTLLVLGFRFYYRRKLEKKMALLEKQQAIEKERTRIATDMHDDLGAGLSRIKFLSETIGIKKQQHEPIEEDVSKIREYSHEMIDKMGEIVWALNEKNDTLSDLLSYTRAYTVEYLSQNGIACQAEVPDNIPTFFVSGEFRRNVFLTIKEALHNVVKHSQATEVKLNILVNHHLSIRLKDNGAGFDTKDIRPFSNGLTNMEARVKEIGGKIEITNKNGTLINLSIPLKT
jgi:signal transduction histidine kinase/ligand-binding sensor domain-containing protein